MKVADTQVFHVYLILVIPRELGIGGCGTFTNSVNEREEKLVDVPLLPIEIFVQ